MRVLLIFFIICSNNLFAKTSNKVFKRKLIQEIKILLAHNELSFSPLNLNYQALLYKSSLIKNAYAQSEYKCLYGGWPSITIKYKTKYYCHNPKNSGFFKHSDSCKKSELTCPKVLFGEDVCAPFKTRHQRLNAFKNCEARQKPYEFDPKIPGKDHVQIMKYIKIAQGICHSNEKDVNKVNCDSIKKKIEIFQKKLINSNQKRTEVAKNAKLKNNSHSIEVKPKVICEPKTALKSGQSKEINDFKEIGAKYAYQQIKENFRNSPLCDPSNNYKESDIPLHAMKGVSLIMKDCSMFNVTQEVFKKKCAKAINSLKNNLNLDSETEKKWNKYQQNLLSGEEINRFRIMLSAKKLLDQSSGPAVEKLAKVAYLKGNILIEEENKITCPFPSFDAFSKSFQGYNKLKHKLKKPILTIVDYSMPSNQRRLFSVDMEKLNVLHNTWVTHGAGTKNITRQVANEDGSSPITSNITNSHLSSDGFILTKEKSTGTNFGKNIVLEGIDINNDKIRSRGIVLHGDKKTSGGYKPLNIAQIEANERLDKLRETSPDSDNYYHIRVGANAPGETFPTIYTTHGCLGVPDYPALNLKTNTREPQLKSLRDEISDGTLIFSYSGNEMKSKYFD